MTLYTHEFATRVYNTLQVNVSRETLPFSVHSFMCYVNYKANCQRLSREYGYDLQPFTYEEYMRKVYSDVGKF